MQTLQARAPRDVVTQFDKPGARLAAGIFFFNDTATTEIYTLSLHDALPISRTPRSSAGPRARVPSWRRSRAARDRKSTRLNSSHSQISYAVFCLKKNTADAEQTLKALPLYPVENLSRLGFQVWPFGAPRLPP